MKRLGYHTISAVNWLKEDSTMRMDLLEELVSRGYHIDLLRKKYQKDRPDGVVALSPGSFTEHNLEKEQSRRWVDTNGLKIGELSATDTWMKVNLEEHTLHASEWPTVDHILAEAFTPFPANTLFQIQMLVSYARKGYTYHLYEVDMGMADALLKRLKHISPKIYDEVIDKVVIIGLQSDNIYDEPRIRYHWFPFMAWNRKHQLVPKQDPRWDCIFIGRDLDRRPRMKQLLYPLADMGFKVGVFGKYEDLHEKFPKVDWQPEVVPRDLYTTMNDSYTNLCLVQKRQAKHGNMGCRYIDVALAGSINIVDARNKNGQTWSIFPVVDTVEEVANQVRMAKSMSYFARCAKTAEQLALFESCEAPNFVNRLEAVLNGTEDV